MVITAEKIRPLFCHHSYCDITLIRDLRVGPKISNILSMADEVTITHKQLVTTLQSAINAHIV